MHIRSVVVAAQLYLSAYINGILEDIRKDIPILNDIEKPKYNYEYHGWLLFAIAVLLLKNIKISEKFGVNKIALGFCYVVEVVVAFIALAMTMMWLWPNFQLIVEAAVMDEEDSSPSPAINITSVFFVHRQ